MLAVGEGQDHIVVARGASGLATTVKTTSTDGTVEDSMTGKDGPGLGERPHLRAGQRC